MRLAEESVRRNPQRQRQRLRSELFGDMPTTSMILSGWWYGQHECMRFTQTIFLLGGIASRGVVFAAAQPIAIGMAMYTCWFSLVACAACAWLRNARERHFDWFISLGIPIPRTHSLPLGAAFFMIGLPPTGAFLCLACGSFVYMAVERVASEWRGLPGALMLSIELAVAAALLYDGTVQVHHAKSQAVRKRRRPCKIRLPGKVVQQLRDDRLCAAYQRLYFARAVLLPLGAENQERRGAPASRTAFQLASELFAGLQLRFPMLRQRVHARRRTGIAPLVSNPLAPELANEVLATSSSETSLEITRGDLETGTDLSLNIGDMIDADVLTQIVAACAEFTAGRPRDLVVGKFAARRVHLLFPAWWVAYCNVQCARQIAACAFLFGFFLVGPIVMLSSYGCGTCWFLRPESCSGCAPPPCLQLASLTQGS